MSITRRGFLKALGVGAGAVVAAPIVSVGPPKYDWRRKLAEAVERAKAKRTPRPGPAPFLDEYNAGTPEMHEALAALSGNSAWYEFGTPHRADGPAVVSTDETNAWYRNTDTGAELDGNNYLY